MCVCVWVCTNIRITYIHAYSFIHTHTHLGQERSRSKGGHYRRKGIFLWETVGQGCWGGGGRQATDRGGCEPKGLWSPFKTGSVSVVKHNELWLCAPQEGRRDGKEEGRRGGALHAPGDCCVWLRARERAKNRVSCPRARAPARVCGASIWIFFAQRSPIHCVYRVL